MGKVEGAGPKNEEKSSELGLGREMKKDCGMGSGGIVGGLEEVSAGGGGNLIVG